MGFSSKEAGVGFGLCDSWAGQKSEGQMDSTVSNGERAKCRDVCEVQDHASGQMGTWRRSNWSHCMLRALGSVESNGAARQGVAGSLHSSRHNCVTCRTSAFDAVLPGQTQSKAPTPALAAAPVHTSSSLPNSSKSCPPHKRFEVFD